MRKMFRPGPCFAILRRSTTPLKPHCRASGPVMSASSRGTPDADGARYFAAADLFTKLLREDHTSAPFPVGVEEVEDLLDHFGLCPGIDVHAAADRQPGRIDALGLGMLDHGL